MKKILALTVLMYLLVSCAPTNMSSNNAQDNTNNTKQVENNDEHNHDDEQEHNHTHDYEIVKIYQDGEEVEVQVLGHGDHYHIIFDGVEYTVSDKEYKMLLEKDNKYILGVGERTEKPTIVSSHKHGDHWHVVYSDGTEDVLHEDPAKLMEEQNK